MNRETGQNLVEFALIITIMLFFIFVIVDLGRITYSYSVLHNATREGARYGVTDHLNFNAIEDQTKHFAIGLDQDELAIAVSLPVEDDGDTIQVAANYNFQAITPVINWIINNGSNNFVLSSVSRMQVEQ